MTEAQEAEVYLYDRFYVLCNSYSFVHLLKLSPRSTAVERAQDRMEALFDSAFEEVASKAHLDEFERIELDSLAKVQLGSGLIALNSLLDGRVN